MVQVRSFETGNRYKRETLHQVLKLIVIKFWVLIPTFLEVTAEKVVRGGLFATPIPSLHPD